MVVGVFKIIIRDRTVIRRARTLIEVEPDFTWFSKPSACGGTSPHDKRVRELRYIVHPAKYAVSTGVVFPGGGGG